MHADTIDELDALKSKVKSELSYRKISIDRLYLQQKDGFLSVFPGGVNQFGDKFDRVLPADSISDLFPFSYSGKVDPKGFSLGRDRFGSGIFVDFDRRAVDITNANIAVLGNSGEGKSYLGKGIITNLAMANKNLIILDPEHEYEELVRNLGGTYLDLMKGDYKINILECRTWNIDDEEDDGPAAFHEKTAVSQHVSFLRDFFRSCGGRR
jgi:type IV secretory pathway VirB4 component